MEEIKVKVIDLLNKIIMGEKVPEKIELDGIVYKVQHNNIVDRDYYIDYEDNCLLETINDVYKLDKEVKIIEDEKIKRLDEYEYDTPNEILIVRKINEIINFLEENKDE